MRVVFFATPQIAQETLEALVSDDNFEVLALVTQCDKPQGRGKNILPPVMKKVAQNLGIRVFQSEKLREDKELLKKLKELKADFFVTFAYGQILSQEILDIPKFGTINIHASLLPKYRGANPIAAAILNNDKVSGITTMMSVLALDAGDICLFEEIKIEEDETTLSLSKKIAKQAPDILKRTLKGLWEGSLKPKPQDENLVSFAHKFKKEDFEIKWGKTAAELDCAVRAMPVFCKYKGKKITITKAKPTDGAGECGYIVDISKEGIVIGCKDKALLIQRVKPEGKGEMEAHAFVNGARLKIGDKFDD